MIINFICYIRPYTLVSFFTLYRVEMLSPYPDESFIISYLAGRCSILSDAAAALSLSQNSLMSIRLYEFLRGSGNYEMSD